MKICTSANGDKKWGVVKSLIAFWIFGLCNNFAYVIMLSAAEDILDEQKDDNEPSKTDNDTSCEVELTSRHCSKISTGAVLLADILPTLIVKLTFPFFMQRIPFGARHVFVCAIQAASYLIVAFSPSIPVSLFGVVLASIGSGLGEITYLSLTPYFSRNTISTWSSGTGGAGVFGALGYAGLTEEHLGNLSPKTTLLVMLVIPAIFFAAYYLLLDMPDTIYQADMLRPSTWIVPVSQQVANTLSVEKGGKTETNDDSIVWDKEIQETASSDDQTDPVAVKQRRLTLSEKLHLVIPLLKYMIPLMTVYIGEYLINQGIVQMIFFNCSHGWHLSRKSQYRWYQVTYQVGVFCSRSSINLVRLPYIVMVLLPILQILNAVLFFLNALYFFIPHIWILFLLILFEGFFGGSSYVNTFDHIHRKVAPDVREYSMSVGSLGDSVGIVIAGFLSIPLYNYVCDTALPT